MIGVLHLKNLFASCGVFYKENEPLSAHTSFRIGGPARWLAEPENAEQLICLLSALREKDIRYFIKGNGSNLLAADEGFDGVVIELGNRFAEVRVEGSCIYAEAGALLSRIANAALDHGLTGLEFAHGIPGSLGGAVFMNAGAYGGEMKDVVCRVTYLDSDLKVCTMTGAEAEFIYRGSIFKQHRDWVILSAEMELHPGDAEQIRELMRDLAGRRRDKQPLEYPSAGSTFKRPEGYFAAKLIEDCGLKGLQVGGAQVSEKHSGFVINKGGATCSDVLALCSKVYDTVMERFGVPLEREIELLGMQEEK
ncbi:MAG: UDP-N-acetylmuramate dehydrogenase [Clostridia bacterium]|nr:UDP-N-acetylmuramate dehydrogenase [Clostridia bacterium]